MKHIPFILLFFFCLLFPSARAKAQFYNGHQMTFGKSRVQYTTFFWNYYRDDRFDVYFNEFGKELADYTKDFVSRELKKTENFFDYTLDKRLIFLVYNKLGDFRQSNIGLISGNDEYNTGGVTKIINNKVFIYFEGDHQKFENQIRGAITEVILNEMLYGNDIRENVANSTLINLPEWYRKGLISYVSQNWSIDLENRVKDGILNQRYGKFNRLEGEDAVFAGHSFWKFIADRYGATVIPNIVYLTRINKNANAGFLYVLGSGIKELGDEWLGYYMEKYSSFEGKSTLPVEGKIVKRPRKKMLYSQVRLNPAGNYSAYVTNQNGRYKVYIVNTETGKRRKIFRKEHKLDQIQDVSYPVLGWNPSGRILAFFTEEKGGIKLYFYNLATREIEYKNFLYFEKILDFSFSPDGLKMVISAVQKGKSDIFIYTLASGTSEQVTNDLADDFKPRFLEGGKKIIFSSNRSNDTLSVASSDEAVLRQSFDLYISDYKYNPQVLINLADAPYSNNTDAFERRRNEFIFLSDRNGIINRYSGRFDSTISFVDTITHYRYINHSVPLTDYPRSILTQDYMAGQDEASNLVFERGRYNSFKLKLPDVPIPGKLKETEYRAILNKQLREKDSIAMVRKQYIPLQFIGDYPTVTGKFDTSLLHSREIDVNNYIFEEEKVNYLNNILAKDNIVITRDTSEGRLLTPKIRIYETSFYTNYIVNQVDFSFLNASYQAYTGGAVYYNPGFNMLFKLGTNDLFEDYKIIGGVRFASDFDSNEYLLSFEDLKKRVDKQIILHRQVFKNYLQESSPLVMLKTQTHQAMYVLKYPFNQVTCVKGTVSFRHDRTVFLSTDLNTLEEPNSIRAWAGLKGEFIFDNTRNLGINLYTGTRYKFFAEYYKQVNKSKSDLWVLGLDFRHYQRIHRTFIWASRFAASSSLGHSRLIYYLGSLDNWINFFPNRYQTFDQSVPVDPTVNYAYQTLATNMRGFTQNIRNGSNFAVWNNELRLPLFRYLFNRPLSSNFLNNFQVVGFGDLGSAWTGLSPYSGRNAYDNEVLEANSYKVTIESNRDPIVAGYGFGVRSQILGYFVRLDWAWGIENKIILPRIFYFSLNLDF
ncbi:MAG: hypothetical protein U0T82_12120 [Bacteroidales bacterium]